MAFSPELLGAGGIGVLAGVGVITTFVLTFYKVVIRPKDRHLESLVNGALKLQQEHLVTLKGFHACMNEHDDDMKQEHKHLEEEVRRSGLG